MNNIDSNYSYRHYLFNHLYIIYCSFTDFVSILGIHISNRVDLPRLLSQNIIRQCWCLGCKY